MRGMGLTAVGFVAASFALAPTAHAAPTLNGETFTAGSDMAGPLPANQCTQNPDGTTSFSITVSGFASGPVNGTFTETANVTIGAPTGATSPAVPFTGPPSQLVALHASFTINGFDGTAVSGTKDLAGTAPGDFGGCRDFVNMPSFAGILNGASQEFVASKLEYHATITQGTQTYTDEGVSSAGAAEAYVSREGLFPSPANGGRNSYGIQESFTSQVLGPSGPATLTLSPPDAVNEIGVPHTVSAQVQDEDGAAVAGTTVRFAVSGASTRTGTCVTDVSGICAFTYNGPLLPGADLIAAYADADGDSQRDLGEPEAEATKAWILPTSTAGHSTGGGQLAGADRPIAFGFNARNTNLLQGECTVIDRDADVQVKCTDVTSVVQAGTHATFFGNGTVNGSPMTYRVDVDDLGEPGAGVDTFTIVTSTGYTAGGQLERGNVQVRA